MAVRLLQFTDTHLRGDASAALRDIVTLDSMRQVLAAARQELAAAEAVLLTGDLVHDDPLGYHWLQQEFGALQKPVLCIPGNHDLPQALRSTLAAAPFCHLSEHRFGRWLIVMLDSYLEGTDAGELSARELARVRALLSTGESQGPDYLLFVLHHPPVSMGSAWLDEIGLRNGSEFLALLAQDPRVRGVLWGHAHQSFDQLYSRAAAPLAPIRLLATPSTCMQFKPNADDFALDPAPPACRYLILQDDGTIDTCLIEAPRSATL
jgi:Icc protein